MKDLYPVYGKELGSAIQDVDKAIAVIKTNKFDEQDLLKLAKACAELIVSAIEEAKNEK